MCCKNNFVAKHFGHLSATHCLCSNVWCSRCSLTHAATYYVRCLGVKVFNMQTFLVQNLSGCTCTIQVELVSSGGRPQSCSGPIP